MLCTLFSISSTTACCNPIAVPPACLALTDLMLLKPFVCRGGVRLELLSSRSPTSRHTWRGTACNLPKLVRLGWFGALSTARSQSKTSCAHRCRIWQRCSDSNSCASRSVWAFKAGCRAEREACCLSQNGVRQSPSWKPLRRRPSSWISECAWSSGRSRCFDVLALGRRSSPTRTSCLRQTEAFGMLSSSSQTTWRCCY